MRFISRNGERFVAADPEGGGWQPPAISGGWKCVSRGANGAGRGVFKADVDRIHEDRRNQPLGQLVRFTK
ncbi:hypothetical protein LB519_15580 [Mesorhizobium sp. AD1-1]|uniref:hypothetical protein n=1 Tax=Mesorhizobium sp. AD1-1 TaxID=2876621 RepID=UPI001CCD949B|nr:hypothetical protein [Mesorhizobium sp. AD1-1]MBZ9719265.1 hypothetical protein [Mesorhizobium sp. AD1-1]